MAGMRIFTWVAVILAALMSSLVSAEENWEEVRRAAESGDAYAQIRLGNAHLEEDPGDVLDPIYGGTGELRRDYVQAYLWLNLGVAGLSDAETDTLMVARDVAIKDLQTLKGRMAPGQLKKAQQLVRDRRQSAPQTDQTSAIREAQQLLRKLGYAPGPVDGKWGPRTEQAYSRFLRDTGLPAGKFSPNVLAAMRNAVQSRGGAGGMKEVHSALNRRDYVTARRLLKPLAARGTAEAQGLLAYAYAGGLGGDRDYAAAVKWARKSADQGHPVGQNALGFLYFFGHGGLTTDYDRAAVLYVKAAQQGLAPAKYMLAHMHVYGLGLPKRYDLAAKWALDAADDGFPHAMVLYAELLEKGNGVQRNRVRAYQAYTIGIHKFRESEGVSWFPSGHEREVLAKAEKALHDLRRRMTPNELAQAEAIVGTTDPGKPTAPRCPDGSPLLFGFCAGG